MNLQCFGSSTLLPVCTNDQDVIYDAVMDMIISIANGLCYLPEPEFFQESLFNLLGTNDDGIVHVESKIFVHFSISFERKLMILITNYI